jgi:ribonuclease HI
MTKFIKKWRKNGWLLSTNLPVENQDLLKLLDREIGKRIVHWRFVKAHTGNQDWYSRWNDVADQEAKKAANS